jgi:hypothetical protein
MNPTERSSGKGAKKRLTVDIVSQSVVKQIGAAPIFTLTVDITASDLLK